MEVVHPRCCGLDVHKASIAACMVIREGGKVRPEKQRFGTTTGELLRLSDWLRELGVTPVAMEATGVYWKPVWHVLEDANIKLGAVVCDVQAHSLRDQALLSGLRRRV